MVLVSVKRRASELWIPLIAEVNENNVMYETSRLWNLLNTVGNEDGRAEVNENNSMQETAVPRRMEPTPHCRKRRRRG